MKDQKIVILPAGDSAVTVQFDQIIDEEVNRQVHILAKKIDELPTKGILESIPAFCSLTVCYDPLAISYSQIQSVIRGLLGESAQGAATEKHVIEIPVCYGGIYGEDLPDVAALSGLSEDEVIRLHSQPDYLIYMLGFLPGFAYLGGLSEKIAVPRLETPRLKIDQGAVGIGGNQTGIYPLASPGGWRIIGRTPLKPYLPDRNPPILYEAGDYLRFVPISEEQFREIASSQTASSQFELEKEAGSWASK